ncbi:hypothetical protein QA612_06315 [Evansella sp. AB-P1]|uniref:BC1872 family protein n=1 Tax=Evansella sp. AB-P1 TaxID=3037653 RepID=UPI00241D4D94|nr:hypothetical protein [Evansella sp. AB-P1]MDG5787101.1 hypothetical protein [Evansella sp. AB-P1]
MNKVEVIARRVLGWKLQSINKWFSVEKNSFIQDFQPNKNHDHAMLVVDRLKEFGFTYKVEGQYKVFFNDVCGTGETLEEAITNAAFELAEYDPVSWEWF